MLKAQFPQSGNMTGAATGLAKLIALFAIGAIIGAGFTSYALQQHPLGSSSSSNSKSIASATTVTQIYQSQVVQTATTQSRPLPQTTFNLQMRLTIPTLPSLWSRL